MKIYDLKNKEDRVYAFEVGNSLISRRRLVLMLSKIPAVTVTRKALKEDEFCEFEVEGVAFVASEDWGDSSRFWIGPKKTEWCPQLQILRGHFLTIKPSFGWWLH